MNLRGPFFAMQAAVADMVARDVAGSIVNVISVSAHAGQPYLAPYVAAKAGLIGLTRNAAHAHRWDRIRINGLNIGWTESEGETETSVASTAVARTGPTRPRPRCRWASSASPARSRKWLCCCFPRAAGW